MGWSVCAPGKLLKNHDDRARSEVHFVRIA